MNEIMSNYNRKNEVLSIRITKCDLGKTKCHRGQPRTSINNKKRLKHKLQPFFVKPSPSKYTAKSCCHNKLQLSIGQRVGGVYTKVDVAIQCVGNERESVKCDIVFASLNARDITLCQSRHLG